MVKEHSQVVVLLMGLLDLAVTAVAWNVCYYLRFHSGLFHVPDAVTPAWPYFPDVMVITLLLSLLVFGRLGLYKPRRLQSMRREVADIAKACLAVWVGMVAIAYFLHASALAGPQVSRKFELLFLVGWPLMLVAYRGTARASLRAFRRRGRNLRTVAVVGAGRLGQKVVHAIRRAPWTGYEVRYFVEDHRVGQSLLGLPIRGPLDQLSQVIESNAVDVVMVALSQDRHAQLADVLNQLSASLVDVNVVPDLVDYHFLGHQVQQVGSLSVVNLTHSPQSGWNAVAKRFFDVVFAAVALVVLSPLMILIALAVKLTTRGPVFYVQRRASLGGREFSIIKFRSMVAGADKLNGGSAAWTPPRDPRVTGVGRLLRRLSLDELPQLINVLVGDMSLVGPRPERPELIERFGRQVPRYMLRHHVKAGITGWAQVNGYRGMTSLRKRIQYDLDYITRWTLAFDLYILLATVLRGFVNRQE